MFLSKKRQNSFQCVKLKNIGLVRTHLRLEHISDSLPFYCKNCFEKYQQHAKATLRNPLPLNCDYLNVILCLWE